METAKLGPTIDELIREFSASDSTPVQVAAPVIYAKSATSLHRRLNGAVVALGTVGIAALVGVGAVLAAHYVIQPPREGVVVTAGAPTQPGYEMWVGNTGGLGACLRAEPNEQSKQAKPCYIDGKQVTVTGGEVNGYLPISDPDRGWLLKRWLLPTRPIRASATPTPLTAPASGQTPSPIKIIPVLRVEPCRAFNDGYDLGGRRELVSSGSYVHVQYWWSEQGVDQPEREAILPTTAAAGGRFILTRELRGHVWEYTQSCTYENVRAQVFAHIQRRLAEGRNNAGFVDWQSTGLFTAAR